MSKNNFTYTLQIDAEIQNVLNKTQQVKKSMESIMSAGKAPGAEKLFDTVEKAIERLQTKASQPITSVAAFENLKKDASAVETALGKLGTVVGNLGNMSAADKLDLLPPDLKQKITDASTALANFAKIQADAAKKSDDLVSAEQELAKAQEALKKAEGRVSEKKSLIEVQKTKVANDRAEAEAIKAKIDALEKYQKTNAAYEKAGADKRKAGGTTKGIEGLNLPKDRAAAQGVAQGLGINLKDAQAVEAALARLNEQHREVSKAVTDAENTQRRYSTQLNEAQNAATVASGKVKALETSVENLNAEFEQNKARDTQLAYEQLRTSAGKLGVDISNIPLDYTEQNFAELNDKMNQLVVSGIAQVDAGMNKIQAETEETNTAVRNLGDGFTVAGEDVKKLDATVSNTTAFTSRIAQFVGLQGGIQIARRAMRDAINTIKELDAAMTEMAVVTDLEVSDYWEQLPRHTEDANKLGVAIKDVYEAETLYYQQGLKTNEVIEMSNQTLKMARIAGLSAEDATNKMTAALRGFNMELNEASAERVADVYSELAAITASDVDEISSAMTKTASIAASAGMEFETTAAFLSQIIETTRESAETAGTALKTVIARFQELKKDPSEIGEVDGEIVDANKIETALRSVGVSLRDAQGQFRELDDVFLELSGKWDSLDTNTQRYIATIAAGSRQQSRFIAMMSDYSRTQELVGAANSSAGASNKQFEKTLDSLESKLNKLSNAWHTFTMGLTDSEVLKTGIDILTEIITKINEFTESFGDFSGAAKIGLLIAALYLGDKALNTFTLSLREGKSILASFGEIGRKSINQLKLGFTGLSKQLKKMSGQKVGADIAPATAAMKQYTKATQNQVTASKLRQTIENNTALSAEARATKLAALDNIQIANEERKTMAVAEYAAAKGLTIEQAGVAMALQSLGIAADVAEAAALGGLTLVKIADYKASMVAQGLDDKEIARRMKKIIAIYAEAGAEKVGNTQKKISIALVWAKIKAFVVETATKIANWVAQMALNVAEATGIALTASYVLVVAALVLVLGLLVVAIIAVVKAIVNMVKNSPENQLKSAEEAADAAAEAANRTAEAYNNLADSMGGLAEKYAALEDITRGTQEWRDAVKEVNDEVLGLIEKYPELAPLVKPENGVLKLDLESEEVQNVLDKYEDKASAAASASLAAKINVNEKQATVTSLGFAEENHVVERVGNENYVREISDQTMQAMAAALNSGDLKDEDGDGSVRTEMTQWLKENGDYTESINAGAFAAALDDDIEALREFGAELYAMSEQERIYKEQMAQNAINAVDASKYTEEQMKQMDVAATSEFADSFTDKYEADFQQAVEDKDAETIESAKAEVAKNLYGEGATVSGNTITYKDENGDEQTKDLTDEEFKEQWAAIQATKDMTAAFEQLPKTINKVASQMSTEAGKAFKAMYAGKEGSAMTKADIKAAEITSESDLWTAWTQLTDEERKAFGSFETMLQQYNDSLAASQEALAQAEEASAKAGIKMMDDISMEAARGYANQMRNVLLYSGESTEQLQKELNDVIGTLDGANKTKFFSALNALDWQSIESLESLPQTLEETGVSVPEEELEEYIELLKTSAGAIRNIDISKIRDLAVELTNLKLGMESGEQGRSLSEESYKALIEMSPGLEKEFQLGLDGQYVYLGSAIENLIAAIEDNTSALLGESTEVLSSKIAMSEIVNAIQIEIEGTPMSFGNLNTANSEEAQREALKLLQENMINNGKEIYGIDGFSTKTDVNKLDGDELDNIISQVLTVTASSAQYSKDLAETAVQAASLVYQGRSAVTNAFGANEASEKGEAGLKEFDARSRSLGVQAVSAGVDDKLVNRYAELVKLYKQGAIEYSEVLEVQKELANSTDYLNMRKGLKGVFEMISEVKEEYDSLAEGDLTGKINVANEALKKFGIQLDENANPDEYMNILNLVSQGNMDAMAQLVQYAQNAAGIPIELGNAFTTTWENLSEQQIAFFDQMANAQMGYWKKIDENNKQFVWATAAEMQSAAKSAGTAVEEWESPYSWLYNYNEEINRLVREREKAERAYTKVLDDETKSASELLAISKQQLGTLEEQAKMNAAGAAHALDDIEAQFEANAQFSKYVAYDAKTNEILIDYTGLEQGIKDEETGAQFEEFLSAIEESRDVILEAEESLNDIEDQIQEIKDRGKDETSELYNQIKEGLVQSRQEEIDRLQSINDSIDEANQSIVEQMQQQIEEARQARENEKAEQDISDKETRLAYLMRDSSNGNAMEIESLKKELSQSKESYTDSLVDQQLQSLQDANEKAAEQRQQQIDIAQAQLDSYANSAQIWTDVKTVLDSSLMQAQKSDNFAEGWMNTEAAKLTNLASDVQSLNPIEKEEFFKELIGNAKLAAVWTGITSVADGTSALQTEAKDTTEAVNAAKGSIESIKTNAGTFGRIGNTDLQAGITSITGDAGHNLASVANAISGLQVKINNATGGSSGGSGGRNSGTTAGSGGGSSVNDSSTNVTLGNTGGSGGVDPLSINARFKRTNAKAGSGWSWKDMGNGEEENGYIIFTTNDGVYEKRTSSWAAANDLAPYAKSAGIEKGQVFYYNGGEIDGEDFKEGFYLLDGEDGTRVGWLQWLYSNYSSYLKYSTGGLADFTGPAWLDGTKSKPEIVLNQTDSANFMQLRDILADILNGTSGISGSGRDGGQRGDNYYDIAISVDSLGSDYDVEQLVDKIRSMIYEDATYRNVNAIEALR